MGGLLRFLWKALEDLLVVLGKPQLQSHQHLASSSLLVVEEGIGRLLAGSEDSLSGAWDLLLK